MSLRIASNFCMPLRLVLFCFVCLFVLQVLLLSLKRHTEFNSQEIEFTLLNRD